ncbi:MAG TPA: rhomboid family intramembrane serine protease [Xanthobacteraceae bacterium]|nr:rhomboid family intramembrane serine protease [Xanthobacteraceae bacterium]
MVMPLWDENPFTKPVKPVVTWLIIAANIVVFLIEVGSGEERASHLIKTYALTPALLTQPTSFFASLPADLTLATYMFLHADVVHLLSNMIFLFVFGDDVERALGRLRFTGFYFACGIVGGLVFAASAPHSAIPLIGASGAVSGVIAAYLMLRPCAKIKVMVFPFFFRLSAYWVIGSYVVIQVIRLASQPDDDVAYWCHVGGLLAGAALFPIMRQPGVELFECTEPRPASVEPPPETTLGGVPREPTVR